MRFWFGIAVLLFLIGGILIFQRFDIAFFASNIKIAKYHFGSEGVLINGWAYRSKYSYLVSGVLKSTPLIASGIFIIRYLKTWNTKELLMPGALFVFILIKLFIS